MKVGTDAILVGAWAGQGCDGVQRILDVGTGCGVVALMVAQRFPHALVDAIDVDRPSVHEATTNFDGSPWADRLRAQNSSFQNHCADHRYDLIVSNPPWFQSGPASPMVSRGKARHQLLLTAETFARCCVSHVTDSGLIAMVVPFGDVALYRSAFSDHGFHGTIRCDVRPMPGREPCRSLLQFSRQSGMSVGRTSLTLELTRHQYSPAYIALAGDFLLRMPTHS